MKSKLAELVEWLEQTPTDHIRVAMRISEDTLDKKWARVFLECFDAIHNKARALLLEETEQLKRVNPSDLWGQHKEMIKLAQDHGLHLAANWAVNMSGRTFSEAKSDEPIAVLADRKGYDVVRVVAPHEDEQYGHWRIYIYKIGGMIDFHNLEYPAAEAAARAYLMGLPDKADDLEIGGKGEGK